jgi:hypothetical protein
LFSCLSRLHACTAACVDAVHAKGALSFALGSRTWSQRALRVLHDP